MASRRHPQPNLPNLQVLLAECAWRSTHDNATAHWAGGVFYFSAADVWALVSGVRLLLQTAECEHSLAIGF